MDNAALVTAIEQKTAWAKRKVLEMCVHANLGHLTTAYSCAEIVAALYYGVMRIDPQDPEWDGRDWFIMSKNHGSLMHYPYLADLGFFPAEELMTFMDDATLFGGHSKRAINGMDFAGGSLGIGLGVGAGIAYAHKMDGKQNKTFVIVGDGETYEGSIWEAAMFAAHNKLDNLITVLDRNHLSCTDFTENMLKSEPIDEKWHAFGWEVRKCNGHDVGELLNIFADVHERKNEKPLIVIADTVKGHGIDFMSNQPLFHGNAPPKDRIDEAFAQVTGGADI
ncbi:transketolase, N-terminal subunit [Spirochaetia bacterium]|nr:transketolase, N-terminal subunit [Spirochaetia bacterium]